MTPRDVDCPTCGASAGHPCRRTGDGRALPVEHVARYDLVGVDPFAHLACPVCGAIERTDAARRHHAKWAHR